MKTGDILDIGRSILSQESQAIHDLIDQLDGGALTEAMDSILNCERLVMVLGSGTSSSIARRLAHVLTCSAVPAIYLDPGHAQHGYSGIITAEDVLIAFSRGGETDEINYLLELAQKRGAKTIGILDDTSSSMAHHCDVVLVARVAEANDSFGVIPLASTLAHAAMSDVLCASALIAKGFSEEDFAELHPGGAVGKRLNSDS
jgi:arabinose-5-phosphate isomerase